jgi:Leucine-rich repeat (LRR) protein
MDTFGDIRSLLQLPPTQERWNTLCALLDAARPSRTARDLVLPYARDHLARWPDPLRMAPWRWLVQTIFEDDPPLGWSLVRHVSFSPAAPLNNSWTERVAGSPHLDGISHLSLTSCHIGGAPLARILDAPCMPHLRALDLSFNHVRDDGLRGITRTQNLRSLERLELVANGVMFHGVKFIGDSPWWPGLKALDLAQNHLNPQALVALGGALDAGALEHLELRANAHGVSHVPSLSRLVCAPGASSLRSLGLAQNNLDAQHVRAIADSPHLTSLERLDLSSGRSHRAARPIEPADMLALRASAAATSLRELSLAGYTLSDEAVAALVDGDELQHLTRLDLRFNAIGDRGANALASAYLPNLRRLDLGYNRLSSRGARALAHAEHLSRLEHLDLFANHNLSDADADRLRASPHLPDIKLVHVGFYESDTA